MSSYSLDLRERIVKAHVEEGQSKSAVARRFEVSRWSVERYVKRFGTGSLAATPHPGRRRRFDAKGCEVLRRQVEAQHDWTLERHAVELAKATGIELKKSSIGNYLKRLGISHKKRVSAPKSEMNKSEPRT